MVNDWLARKPGASSKALLVLTAGYGVWCAGLTAWSFALAE